MSNRRKLDLVKLAGVMARNLQRESAERPPPRTYGDGMRLAEDDWEQVMKVMASAGQPAEPEPEVIK